MALTFFAFSYYSLSFGQSAGVFYPMAEDVEVDTTNFNNNLNATDTDVQKCLDKLDDLSGGASQLSDLNDVGTVDYTAGKYLRADGTDYDSANIQDGDLPDTITRDSEWDTIGEIETATGVDIITSTENNDSADDLSDNVLNDLNDTTISTPASGQYLSYNGTAWVNQNIQEGDLPNSITRDNEWDTIGEIETVTGVDIITSTENNDSADDLSDNSINDLSDVTVSTPSDGQVLKYNAGTGKWENKADDTGTDTLDDLSDNSINDLSDVAVSSPSDGQLLKYNATSTDWENWTPNYLTAESDPVFSAMDTEAELENQITDVSNIYTNNDGSLTDDDLSDNSIGDLSDIAVSSPSDGQLLKYNATSTQWENWSPNYLTSETDPVFSGVDTEAELENHLTDVTNIYTNNDGSLMDDDLSNNSINDLSDVVISSPANTQVLKYNSTSEKWENATDDTGNDSADDLSDNSINDLSDVDTTGWAENKLLKFDASGSLVVGTDNVDDADADATNELQNIFQNISDGTNTAIADTTTDTFTLEAGTGISITVDETNDKATITNTGDTDASDDLTTSTTFGGDVSGTYDTISVNKIKGKSVDDTNIADGKVLKYNSTSGNLEYQDDNDTTYSAGTGLSLSGTTFSLSHLGLESLTDPNANRLYYWNDTNNTTEWLDYSNWDTDASDDLLSADLDTEAELEAQLTDVTNVYTNNDGALTDDDLSDNTTDDLAEGTSNLYFTNERVDDRVATLIQNGTGLSWTYDDVNNTLTGNVSLSPFSTDDLAEGSTNKYFSGKTQDDLPDGTTYKQYNPANVSITGGTISGVSSVVIGTDPGGSYPLRVGGDVYANGRFLMKSDEVFKVTSQAHILSMQTTVGNEFSNLKNLQIEYYDYNSSSWTTWSDISASNLEKLFSGAPCYSLRADYTHRKYRITGTSVASPLIYGIGIVKTYDSGCYHTINFKLEISTDGGSTWTTKIDEQNIMYGEGFWWFTYYVGSGGGVLWRFTFDCPDLGTDQCYKIGWIYGSSAGYPGRTSSIGLGSINRGGTLFNFSRHSFLPMETETYDLGSSDYKWKNLYTDKVISDYVAVGGITSPDRTLHVQGDIKISDVADGVPTFEIRETTNDNAWYLNIEGGNSFNIKAGSNYAIRIDTSGKVGIHTTPSEDFHVNGNARITGALQVGNEVNTGLSGSPTDPQFSFESDQDTGMYRDADDCLGFSTGGNARAYIDSSGNIGIGTNSIPSLLSLRASGLYANTNSNFPLSLPSSDTSLTALGNTGPVVLNLQRDATNDGEKIGGIWFTIPSGQADAHRQVAGIWAERRNIASQSFLPSGRVIIGWKTGGAGYASGLICEAGDGVGKIVLESDLNFVPDNGYRWSPKLVLRGCYDSDPTEGNVTRSTSEYFLQTILENTSGDARLGIFNNEGTEVISVKDDKVGIGTISPGHRLSIQGLSSNTTIGDSSDTALFFRNIDASAYNHLNEILFAFGASEDPGASIAAQYTHWVDSAATLGASLIFSTTPASTSHVNPVERMRITHDGYVGIGNSSPQYTLVVQGSTDPVLKIIDTNDVSWTHSYKALAPNLSAGHHYVFAEGGIEESQYNTAWIGFYMDSKGSSNNRLSMGLWGVDDVFIIQGNANVGIREINPSNILTIQQNSSTDPIADAWTTYSTRDSKIIINEVERDETDKLLQSFLKVPLHRYKKKLEKLKFTYPAILQKYEKKELSSAFQEYLKDMKEYKKKQTLQKFNNVYFGMVAEEAPEICKTYDEDGKLIGINNTAYIGWLHANLKALVWKVKELEKRVNLLEEEIKLLKGGQN